MSRVDKCKTCKHFEECFGKVMTVTIRDVNRWRFLVPEQPPPDRMLDGCVLSNFVHITLTAQPARVYRPLTAALVPRVEEWNCSATRRRPRLALSPVDLLEVYPECPKCADYPTDQACLDLPTLVYYLPGAAAKSVSGSIDSPYPYSRTKLIEYALTGKADGYSHGPQGAGRMSDRLLKYRHKFRLSLVPQFISRVSVESLQFCAVPVCDPDACYSNGVFGSTIFGGLEMDSLVANKMVLDMAATGNRKVILDQISHLRLAGVKYNFTRYSEESLEVLRWLAGRIAAYFVANQDYVLDELASLYSMVLIR